MVLLGLALAEGQPYILTFKLKVYPKKISTHHFVRHITTIRIYEKKRIHTP